MHNIGPVEETSVVTRASLGDTFPIVTPISMTLLPARIWTRDQWRRIERGYRSRGMDEKWDVFVESGVAFLHRSWTGHGMFEASFARAGCGWRISAAVASRERVRHVSEQLNRVLLELVLSAVVLGEPATDLRAELVRLTLTQDGPAPPDGVIEHTILGLRSTR